jgi:hypothetical protein
MDGDWFAARQPVQEKRHACDGNGHGLWNPSPAKCRLGEQLKLEATIQPDLSPHLLSREQLGDSGADGHRGAT